jgi:hypothetical protein
MKFLFLFLFMSSAFSSEWKFVENYEGIKLFELENSSLESTPFKAVGFVKMPIQEVIKALLDVNQKSKWAPKLKEVKIHKKLGNNKFVFSEFYKTPWPYYDREFLLVGEIFNKEGKVYFKAKNLNDSSINEDNDHVAANVEILDFVLKEQDGGTHITFSFNGDMGGWIPSFVSRIIRKKWPVRFIQALENWSINGKIETTIDYINYKKSIVK